MKIVERAKLMGIPAIQVGKIGGEFSAPLTELHDPWWNSIARAMA